MLKLHRGETTQADIRTFLFIDLSLRNSKFARKGHEINKKPKHKMLSCLPFQQNDVIKL